MIKFILLGLLTVSVPPANLAFAGEFENEFRPRVDIEYDIRLSTGMEAALKAYDSDFEIWKAHDFESFIQNVYTYGPAEGEYFRTYQALSIVIGDFNGDKVPDVALLGHNKTDEKKIVVLSKGCSYEILELSSYPLTDPMRPNVKRGGGNLRDRKSVV